MSRFPSAWPDFLSRVCVLLALGSFLLISGCEHVIVCNQPGGIQILGTETHLYLFLQVSRLRSSSAASYDAPSSCAIGNSAILAVIDSDGTSSCQRIDLPQNFSLNPNISHVFYDRDRVCFFADVGDRIGDQLMVCQLEQGTFREVSMENDILRAIIERERNRITYHEIDQFSLKQGATLIHTAYQVGRTYSFAWKQQIFTVSTSVKNGNIHYDIEGRPLLKQPIQYTVPQDIQEHP